MSKQYADDTMVFLRNKESVEHYSLRYQCTPNDHHTSAPRYGQTFDANPSKVYIF